MIYTEIDYIAKAMQLLAPGASFSIAASGYSSLDWTDNNIEKPTEDKFNDALLLAKTLLDSEKYQVLRLQEYPAIGDQLDALFHAGVFPPEMAAQIQAVKDKYPKPESVNV